MSRYLSENRYFLIPYVFLLVSGLIAVICLPKAELHLAVNRFHNFWLDRSMAWITMLGNGLVSLVAGLALLFFSFRRSVIVFSSFAASGLLVQFIKKAVFPGMVRPHVYFQTLADLHIVDGVYLLHSQSFPSGHTATAFALFGSLALMSRRKWIQVVCLFIASLVGYSRIYLSQHFMEDVLAGSLLGVLFAFLAYGLFRRMRGDWLDRSFSLEKNRKRKT